VSSTRSDALCGDFYVGKTKRTLTTRLKEYKTACRLGAFEISVVAEHAWQEGHEIDWNDVEILDTAKDLQERKVKDVSVRVHQDGSQDLLDEQRQTAVAVAKNHLEQGEGETKTSSSTNPET
jgi:FlaA1/EpsC-like NDP-sugar epimerase